jgi:hypothetical protein
LLSLLFFSLSVLTLSLSFYLFVSAVVHAQDFILDLLDSLRPRGVDAEPLGLHQPEEKPSGCQCTKYPYFCPEPATTTEITPQADTCCTPPEINHDCSSAEQIAEIMREEIVRGKHLERRSLARRLFEVYLTEPGVTPKVERDAACCAYVVPHRGAVPEEVCEGDYVDLKTFEIAARHSIRAKETGNRLNYLSVRMAARASEVIQREEDLNFLSLCRYSLEHGLPDNLVVRPFITREGVLSAFQKIERNGMRVAKIVIHDSHLKAFREIFRPEDFQESAPRDFIASRTVGHLWTADVLASPRQEVDFLLFAASEPAGVVAVSAEHALHVIPFDDVSRLRAGAVVYEDIGLAVTKPYALAGLVLDEPKTPVPVPVSSSGTFSTASAATFSGVVTSATPAFSAVVQTNQKENPPPTNESKAEGR